MRGMRIAVGRPRTEPQIKYKSISERRAGSAVNSGIQQANGEVVLPVFLGDVFKDVLDGSDGVGAVGFSNGYVAITAE
jgi:hypothetical protein